MLMKTKEEAYAWLKATKQRKLNSIERMKEVCAQEFEKRTGQKPTYVEVL